MANDLTNIKKEIENLEGNNTPSINVEAQVIEAGKPADSNYKYSDNEINMLAQHQLQARANVTENMGIESVYVQYFNKADVFPTIKFTEEGKGYITGTYTFRRDDLDTFYKRTGYTNIDGEVKFEKLNSGQYQQAYEFLQMLQNAQASPEGIQIEGVVSAAPSYSIKGFDIMDKNTTEGNMYSKRDLINYIKTDTAGLYLVQDLRSGNYKTAPALQARIKAGKASTKDANKDKPKAVYNLQLVGINNFITKKDDFESGGGYNLDSNIFKVITEVGDNKQGIPVSIPSVRSALRYKYPSVDKEGKVKYLVGTVPVKVEARGIVAQSEYADLYKRTGIEAAKPLAFETNAAVKMIAELLKGGELSMKDKMDLDSIKAKTDAIDKAAMEESLGDAVLTDDDTDTTAVEEPKPRTRVKKTLAKVD